VLEEGECFGHPSLIGKTSPHVDVVAAEDTLIYQVPGDSFDRLMPVPEFAQFFLVDLSERLRQTSASRPLPLGRELGTPVGRQLGATPVSVPCETTVGDAARLMREKRISSVLVECEPPGILTARDLRSRVLAEGRGPETKVGEVATRPMRTISADATLFETLVFMLEHHLHHAPLERDGHVIGIVTDTDLLRLYMKTPMVETMVWGGLTAAQVGPVASRLNDALVARFLRIAESELGPPPVPYAWILFGSEGRMEQTLLTDQDNAIVYADAEGAHDACFKDLAERTVRALMAAAFPPCPGGFMATNWRRPLSSWVALFREWVEKPEPRALVEALNFFDFRAVHGALDLAVLDDLLLRAGREQLFMAHFARALRAGGEVTNHIRLEHLEPVERQHLTHIFVAIREIQHAAQLRYAVQGLA